MSKAITATDDLEIIRAEIFGSNEDERCEAEESSQLFYQCTVAELNIDRAKSLLRILRIDRRERKRRSNPMPGTCFQCGAASTKGECIPCHEGYSASEFNRIRPVSFGVTEPNRIGQALGLAPNSSERN